MSQETAATVIKKIDQLEKDREALIRHHQQKLEDIDRELGRLRQLRALNTQGLDVGRIAAAERVIWVKGDVNKSVGNAGVRKEAVEDAIREIANNPHALCDRYIGVKNYSGFGDQRADHSYGMGPKHGHIVFEIGRSGPTRERDLAETERDAAIYYLENLSEIHAQKEGAA